LNASGCIAFDESKDKKNPFSNKGCENLGELRAENNLQSLKSQP